MRNEIGGVMDERIDRMEEGRGRMYSTYEGGGVREEGEWKREGDDECGDM